MCSIGDECVMGLNIFCFMVIYIFLISDFDVNMFG